MGLTFDESLALALYVEFYGRCYSPLDLRKKTLGSDVLFQRHMEMKSMYLLLQEANVSLGANAFGYDFSYNRGKLLSSELKRDLDSLDKKVNAIDNFYKMYCDKRDSMNFGQRNYFDQLKARLSSWIRKENDIITIARLFYGLEDILQEEKGAEIAAIIVYLNKFVYHCTPRPLGWIFQSLNEFGYYHPSEELLKRICKILRVLGLLEIEPKRELNSPLEDGEPKRLVPTEQK